MTHPSPRLRPRPKPAAINHNDLHYHFMDSPVGKLLLVSGEKGLMRLAFESQGHESILDDTAINLSTKVVPNASKHDAIVKELDEYFLAERRTFDFSLDTRLVRSLFQQEVIKGLRTIPFGQTRTYIGLAKEIGHPLAARAVGTACARNPLPIVIPCHRVIKVTGAPGFFVTDQAIKKQLLALES